MCENKFKGMLLGHYRSYPDLEIRDLIKFIHQSAFGCEHLVASSDAAAEYIAREYEGSLDTAPEVEPLCGGYSRVHLSTLGMGLSPITLAKLFCMSAKPEPSGAKAAEVGLSALLELVRSGEIPFSYSDTLAEVEKWRAEGYAPKHHSVSFSQKYRPAYRVIDNKFIPYLELFIRIDSSLADSGSLTLAIEGGSASGKTTLSEMLSALYGCTVFHIDDFFLRPEQRTAMRYAECGGNFDRERFLSEVLLPLRGGEVSYRKFNCSTLTLTDPISVSPTPFCVIEGAYSMHPELSSYYDLSVFLDIDTDLQRARIEKRNTPDMAKRFFAEWIPREREYFEKTDVAARCDMIIKIK